LDVATFGIHHYSWITMLMFKDISSIKLDVKLSKTKVSYLFSVRMGLHFKRELIDDFSTSQSKNSMHFDETTQVQVTKTKKTKK